MDGDVIKLLFATGNKMKFELMKRRLSIFDNIELIMPKDLNISINVLEDGKTSKENAIKKASEYYKVTHMATIAEDSELWIKNFSDSEQPGVFVKRINGQENLTDEEVLDYYIKKINNLGGSSEANYRTSFAIISEDGTLFSKTINEKTFIMKGKKNDIEYISGGVLDCISFDQDLNKYFNEFTEEDKNFRYKIIDEEVRNIFKKVFNNK